MELALILLVATVVLWLNVKATLAIARDDRIQPGPRLAQLGFVLAVPLVGAVIVLAFRRQKR